MPHELPLLVNIAVALGAALVGGLLARAAGVPTIVGYLLAGVAIGPFTPGFVGDPAAIGQLAELGVVFLMFGVGLHFSLSDLWRVRRVAVPGAIAQMAVATLLGYALARYWGWSLGAGLVLGLSISVASTVVLLRGLMDNGMLDTRHGRVAIGWLVLEDLATVVLLLVLPALATSGGGIDARDLGLRLLKAALFVGLMLLFGSRLVPWALLRIAHTRSRELFVLVALTAALGTALGASALFGVSLALGAFLAGVVVGESPLSHQVGADVLPFREAFAVLFFVSVGMLVDPAYLLAHAGPVLALTVVIVLGKAIAALALVLALGQPALTGLVVAAGLGQIGEFSFILGQAGVRLGLLQPDQYSLILAGALVSITVNPLAFGLVGPLERSFARSFLARRSKTAGPEVDVASELARHVVVVGWGRVGSHVVDVLGRVGVPRLVVESDAARVERLRAQGVPVLYGDAANSEILAHAGLARARVLVVTIPDEAAAGLVVAGALRIAPGLSVVARAATLSGVKHLVELGAQLVIHPELEGGLEVVRHTLLRLGLPLRDIQKHVDAVRRESYVTGAGGDDGHRVLHRLLEAAQNLEVVWVAITESSPFSGRTLAQTELRARTGASIVAIERGGSLMPSPAPDTTLRPGDRLGLIGKPEDIEAGERLLSSDGASGPREG